MAELNPHCLAEHRLHKQDVTFGVALLVLSQFSFGKMGKKLKYFQKYCHNSGTELFCQYERQPWEQLV